MSRNHRDRTGPPHQNWRAATSGDAARSAPRELQRARIGARDYLAVFTLFCLGFLGVLAFLSMTLLMGRPMAACSPCRCYRPRGHRRHLVSASLGGVPTQRIEARPRRHREILALTIVLTTVMLTAARPQ